MSKKVLVILTAGVLASKESLVSALKNADIDHAALANDIILIVEDGIESGKMITDLQTEVASLKLEKENLLLKAENLDAISKELTSVKSENSTLAEVNKELTLQVEELSSEQLPVKELKAIDHKSAGFTRNGKNYSFNYGRITLKGGRAIGVAEVLADEALQDELIETACSMIKVEVDEVEE